MAEIQHTVTYKKSDYNEPDINTPDKKCAKTLFGNECVYFDAKGKPISHTITSSKQDVAPAIPKIESSKQEKLPKGIGKTEIDTAVVMFKTEDWISLGNIVGWKLHINTQQLKAIPELARFVWKNNKPIVIDEKYLRTISPPRGYIMNKESGAMNKESGTYVDKDGVVWDPRLMNRPLYYQEFIELIKKRLEKISSRFLIDRNISTIESRTEYV